MKLIVRYFLKCFSQRYFMFLQEKKLSRVFNSNDKSIQKCSINSLQAARMFTSLHILKIKNRLRTYLLIFIFWTYYSTVKSNCYIFMTVAVMILRVLIFSSPRTEGSGGANRIGSGPSSSVVVCKHFQTASPLKPLGQLDPNFNCGILGLRD